MFEHDLSTADAAAAIGVSQMQFSRYLLPFDHPKRQVPRALIMGRIMKLTGGVITAAQHYPPELSARPGCTATLAAARAE